jgi:hypothetical protein
MGTKPAADRANRKTQIAADQAAARWWIAMAAALREAIGDKLGNRPARSKSRPDP